MSATQISANKRDPKSATGRALRRSGRVPGVYYTSTREIKYVDFNDRELTQLLKKEIGLLELKLGSETLACVIREVQRHPVRGDIIHVDLFGVDRSKKIRVHVPVHVTGIAPGVKEGGNVDIVLHSLDVECLPNDIPNHIDVDISELNINDGIRIGDLKLERIEVHGDPLQTIVHVVPPRKAEDELKPSTEAAEPEVITAKKEESED